jgi:hypothetical protein
MKKSSLIDATRQYDAFTANGAVTHSTTLSACVDLFFIAGASRSLPADALCKMFQAAFNESPTVAMRILFWARDCRGGAGEKRFFRTIAHYLREYYPEIWTKVRYLTPDFGSWKDIFEIDIPTEDNLRCMVHDLEYHSQANLLAKWFPRKGKWFVNMHHFANITPSELRKYLVSKSNTVEQLMCSRKFSEIEYTRVPSIAMNKYRTAFGKHDGIRFAEFIEAALKGEVKINANVLFPHQLYDAIEKGQDEQAVEAQWRALPDYMTDSEERIIPVCDVSGSMTDNNGLPMSVSVSLGLYISERNKGIFKDAFITFSTHPQMEYVKGNTLAERMRSIRTAHWGMSTDLIAVFRLILNSAIRESIPENEMPTKILIISDMELNIASNGHHTNLDVIKAAYAEAGYKMPEIIFWNVNGSTRNFPAQANEPGIGLVSGFSPAILQAILKGQVLSPADLMLTAIAAERYDSVEKALRDE